MRVFIAGLFMFLWSLPAAAQLRPMVYADITVDAPISDVWTDWTTEDGLESFFTPKAIIDLKPGGAFEAWFLPDAPKGQRGAEDGIILGLQPERMIHFTWAMPPYMPEIRRHMTVIQIQFVPVSDTRTHIRLFHTGFGTGEAWEKGRIYFDKTWPNVLSGYQAHITKTEE